jgi:hypothetical protein
MSTKKLSTRVLAELCNELAVCDESRYTIVVGQSQYDFCLVKHLEGDYWYCDELGLRILA